MKTTHQLGKQSPVEVVRRGSQNGSLSQLVAEKVSGGEVTVSLITGPIPVARSIAPGRAVSARRSLLGVPA
ncbi:MAG: hypothetical protein ACYTG0_19705, partial [Planctomycetota bacterium]